MSELGVMFEARLRRLLRLRAEAELNDAGARLVERSIWATYIDCLDHGADADAVTDMVLGVVAVPGRPGRPRGEGEAADG